MQVSGCQVWRGRARKRNPLRWLFITFPCEFRPFRGRLCVSAQPQRLQVHTGSCISQRCQHKRTQARQRWAGPTASRWDRWPDRPQRAHQQPPTSSLHLRTFHSLASRGHHTGLRVLPPPHSPHDSRKVTCSKQRKSISRGTYQAFSADIAISQCFGFFFNISFALYFKPFMFPCEKIQSLGIHKWVFKH